MEALQGLLKRVGDIMEFNTALLHRGFEIDKKTGATLTPIYQVSAFSQESAEQLEKSLLVHFSVCTHLQVWVYCKKSSSEEVSVW